MTIDPYIILGAAIVGFLVGMTGAGDGALLSEANALAVEERIWPAG
jgi:hypothetical protein